MCIGLGSGYVCEAVVPVTQIMYLSFENYSLEGLLRRTWSNTELQPINKDFKDEIYFKEGDTGVTL